MHARGSVAVGPKAAGTEEDSVTMKRTAVGVACQQYVCQKKEQYVNKREMQLSTPLICQLEQLVHTNNWSTKFNKAISTHRWVKESMHRLLHTLGVLHTHTADAHNGVAHTGNNEVSC